MDSVGECLALALLALILIPWINCTGPHKCPICGKFIDEDYDVCADCAKEFFNERKV